MDTINQLDQYITENQLEEAIELIVREYDYFKDDVTFLNLKAIACIKIGEIESATRDLEQAMTIAPRYADSYFNMAYIYEMKGDYCEAALYFGYAQKYTQDAALLQELEQHYQDVPVLKQIQEIIAKGRKKHFIILSSCGWSGALQRMQHIARALTKLGQNVSYMCPEINIDLSEQLRDTVMDQSLVDSVYEQMMNHTLVTTKKSVEGIEVYTPYRNVLSQQHVIRNYQAICQTLINSNEESVIISYLPSQVDVINELQGNFRVIYECVDDHLDTDYVNWGTEADAFLEDQLKERADAITTTATALFLRNAIEEKRDNVYLSRNALNYSDFVMEEDYIPEDIKDIPSPRIVYTGAIYEWFDMDLFNEMVKSNPDKSFIILGFGKQELFTQHFDNLYLLGEKKHNELKYYLRQCDIGIIPFKDDIDLIVNCDPIKQYEYIMCGLPVICTCIPECIIGKENTYIAQSVEEFNEKIQQILHDEKQSDIVHFSIQNSWYNRAAILYSLAENNQDLISSGEQVYLLQRKLEEEVAKNKQPILKALWSKSLVNTDIEKARCLAVESFDELPIKYVEQNKLYVLSQIKDEQGMYELMCKAKNIPRYLIDEYIVQYKNLNFGMLHILRLLLKKSYMKVIKEQIKLQGIDRVQVAAYCYLKLGEKQEAFKLLKPIKKEQLSPLGTYLYEEIVNKI